MRGSDDFFHSHIDQMIDLSHPFPVLASHMPWQEIEASLAKQLAREVKKGRSIQEVGLFGSQTAFVDGGVSKAGRPRLTFRLIVSLLVLKHAFNESDEVNCPGNRGGWLVLIMRLLSIPADYARIVPQTLRVGCDRWVQGDVLG